MRIGGSLFGIFQKLDNRRSRLPDGGSKSGDNSEVSAASGASATIKFLEDTKKPTSVSHGAGHPLSFAQERMTLGIAPYSLLFVER